MQNKISQKALTIGYTSCTISAKRDKKKENLSEMEKEKIVEYLRGYRETRARANCLREEISLLEKLYERMQTPEKLIEANVLAARPVTVGGRGGMPGDPAAKLAVEAADGGDRLNPYASVLLAAQNELLRAQYRCRVVDAWMEGLCEREKWMVQRHAIERLPFSELPELYEKECGRAYCIDTLKALYKRGIEAICRMSANAGENIFRAEAREESSVIE